MKGDIAHCAYSQCGKEFVQKYYNDVDCCSILCGANYREEKKNKPKNPENERIAYDQDGYNPNPVTIITCTLIDAAIKKGESISQIAADTHRDPAQIQEIYNNLTGPNRAAYLKAIKKAG